MEEERYENVEEIDTIAVQLAEIDEIFAQHFPSWKERTKERDDD
jgi:hypothetical protein